MENNIILKVDSKYFYQLLIKEVRYACSRNNHLEPSSTFEELKSILPMYYDQDSEWGMKTAKQICEEVINELVISFPDGEDNTYKNREHYLDMILWLLDFIVDNEGEWKPYNWDNYIYNIATDCTKQYFIKDLDTDEVYNKYPLSRKEYLDYIMKEIIKSNEATYSVQQRYNLIVYNFQTPIKKNLIVYKIEDKNEGDSND